MQMTSVEMHGAETPNVETIGNVALSVTGAEVENHLHLYHCLIVGVTMFSSDTLIILVPI